MTTSAPGFAAFLSYSRSNYKLARKLQNQLEDYRAPKGLTGRPYGANEHPARVGKICLDLTDFEAGSSVQNRIVQKLNDSRFLIVICSPDSARSPYVDFEIRHFIQHRGRQWILPFVVEGDPKDANDDTCFPAALREQAATNESDETALGLELLAADARKGADGWDLAVLKLLARLLDLPLGILLNREQQRRTARLRKVAITVSCLAAAFLAIGLIAVLQWREAERQSTVARQTLAQSQYIQSIESIEEGDTRRALALLAQAVRNDPLHNSARVRAFTLLSEAWRPILIGFTRIEGENPSLQFSTHGKYVLVSSSKATRVYDFRSNSVVFDNKAENHVTVREARFGPDDRSIFIVDQIGESQPKISLESVDLNSGESHGDGLVLPGSLKAFAVSPNREALSVITSTDFHFFTLDKSGRLHQVGGRTNDGSLDWEMPLEVRAMFQTAESSGYIDILHISIGFSSDSRYIYGVFTWVFGGSVLARWDALTGQATTLAKTKYAIGLLHPSHNKYLLSSSPTRGIFEKISKPWGFADVWDADTGRQLSRVGPHKNVVTALDVTPDGNSFLTASLDGTVRVWSFANAAQQHFCDHGDEINAAQFSRDGRFIATAGSDGIVRVWNSMCQPLTARITHDAPVVSLSFSPDNTAFAAVSVEGSVFVWGLGYNPLRRYPLSVRNSEITDATFFADETGRVVTVSSNGNVQLLDIKNASSLPLGPFDASNEVIRFAPDMRRIFIASGDTGEVIDVETGERVSTFFRHPATIRDASFNQGADRLLTSTVAGTVSLWNLDDGAQMADLSGSNGSSFAWFHPSKPIIAVGSGADIDIWDAEKLIPTQSLINTHTRMVFTIPGSDEPVGGRDDRVAHLVPPVLDVQFAPSDTRLLALYGFPPTGNPNIPAQAFSAAVLWDWSGDIPTSTDLVHDDQLMTAVMSPNGNVVLTGALDGTATLWSTQTGEPIHPKLHHTKSVTMAVFSPDSESVLVVEEGGLAKLWDVTTGRQQGQLLVHANSIGAAAFSRDGSLIATGSDDGQVVVWDAETTSRVSDRMWRAGGFRKVAFSGDGAWLLTVTDDKQAWVWQLQPEASASAYETIATLAETIGGIRLNERGVAEIIDGVERFETIQRLRKSTSNDPWRNFARWYASDISRRSSWPWSAETTPEHVKSLLRDGSLAAVIEALKLEPGNPLALAQMGHHLAEEQGDELKLGLSRTLIDLAMSLDPDDPTIRELHEKMHGLLEDKPFN